MKNNSLTYLAFQRPQWYPKAVEPKHKCSFICEACVALFPTWSLTQLTTQFLKFYWFRMLWLEFVIFSQPMVRVTIIYDWVTTIIVVHHRFQANGYTLLVPRVPYHKMDLQWKPQSNLCKKFSHLYYMKYWSNFLQLCMHMQIADTKMDLQP